jgi:hypothetical protein
MLLFWKLVDKTQIPHTDTDTFIITYKLFLVGLRGLYFMSNPDGTPCIYVLRLLNFHESFDQPDCFRWKKNNAK